MALLLFCLAQPSLAQAPGDAYAQLRQAMVRTQIQARGVTDPRVLEALREVPRHLFVPWPWRALAYTDGPLPIGHGQTISQPLVVALMTEALKLRGQERVLEIGTGSGYQAAVLSLLAAEVYSIEIVPELAREAEQRLRLLGYSKVRVRAGDGYQGWPEAAPFAAIVVTAAPESLPPRLLEQLAPGGRMALPVGPAGGDQSLTLVEKDAEGRIKTTVLEPVRFVPMVKEAR